MEPEIKIKSEAWLTETFDVETQNAIKKLQAEKPEELKESFYKNLEFGTGGMRGIMGVGTNRINKYTLGKNTQGLSNFMNKYEWEKSDADKIKEASRIIDEMLGLIDKVKLENVSVKRWKLSLEKVKTALT